MLVRLQMASQLSNAGGHNRYLHGWRATVLIMGLQVLANLGLLLTRNHLRCYCSKLHLNLQLLKVSSNLFRFYVIKLHRFVNIMASYSCAAQ